VRTPAGEVRVREAAPAEVIDALGILEPALLEVDPGRLRSLAEGDGAVLLAVEGGRTLGALVLGDGAVGSPGDRRIEAVAVRPGRRGQGIGRALVRTASERARGSLIAAFDSDLRPFYERLGFDVEPAGDGRYRGRLDGAPD